MSSRGKKPGEALGASGKPVVLIWVPDTSQPGFAAECARQTELVASADRRDHDLAGFMDAVLAAELK